MSRILFLPFVAILFSSAISRGESALNLQSYLEQVKANNSEVKGALEASQGALRRSVESQLILSPNFFVEAGLLSDAKLPMIAFYNIDRTVSHSYSLGFSKRTSFGQDLKLYYNVSHTKFVNMVFPGGGGPPQTSFFDAKPVIEVSQSLWSNGFGRGTRAQIDAQEAQAKAVGYSARFRARLTLVTAEQAYWRLVLAREKVEVQKVALDQAKKIFQWSDSRAKRSLADQADALQAKAALEVRELEMQSAIDDELDAARNFNKFRNSPKDDVAEELGDVQVKSLLSFEATGRDELRDDVLAAREQQNAAVASAQLSIENDRPKLDAYGSFAMNGRDDSFGGVLGNSYSANRPTFSVGVKLAVPLDRGVASEAYEGLRQEQRAAELTYEQKLRDQEIDWNNLVKQLAEGKRRLGLSQKIVAAQRAKLSHERERLKQGRTTTFQVLLFEQEYAQAQLSLIKAEADIIGTVAQTKLFGGSL